MRRIHQLRPKLSRALVLTVSAGCSHLPGRARPPQGALDAVGLWGPLRGKPFAMRSTQVGAGFIVGSYEREVVRRMRSVVRPGMSCYDIGASYGFYSLLLSGLVGPRGHVDAFEPGPADVAILRHNLAANRITNVSAHQLALSDRTGSVEFATFSYPLVSHIRREGTPGDAIVTMVPCTTLDEFAASATSPAPQVIKLDVEGTELEVLQGGAATLRAHRPVVFAECSESRTLPAAAALLGELGYRPPVILREKDTLVDALFEPA